MTRDPTLSEEVQSLIDDWDSDHHLSPKERDETEQYRKVIRAVVDDIIASRETLTDNKLVTIEKFFEETPDLIHDLLDSRFTRDVIDAVPGYVKRLLELSRLQGSNIPSEVTNGYLREAVRTYIFGFPQASIALCRAAMEQALKENLGYQGNRTFLKMEDLLDEAENDPDVAPVIDKTIRQMARKIANEADDVLHERPTDLAKAYEVLLLLRGVLQHIYGE